MIPIITKQCAEPVRFVFEKCIKQRETTNFDRSIVYPVAVKVVLVAF